MDWENHGNKRKCVSSIIGEFYGRSYLWFLFLYFSSMFQLIPGRWGVSYLRLTIPLGGEDKTVWLCCLCSPVPTGWWCVGDTWWGHGKQSWWGVFSIPYLYLALWCGRWSFTTRNGGEVFPSQRPHVKMDGGMLTAEFKSISNRWDPIAINTLKIFMTSHVCILICP